MKCCNLHLLVNPPSLNLPRQLLLQFLNFLPFISRECVVVCVGEKRDDNTMNARHQVFLRRCCASYSKVNFHSGLLRLQSKCVSVSSLLDFILCDCLVSLRVLALWSCETHSKTWRLPECFPFIVLHCSWSGTQSHQVMSGITKIHRQTTKWT